MGRTRILLIDDSLTFRNTLGDRLRSCGYEMLLARCGEEALHCLEPMPDAIVVDLEMPGINGIETCRRIRSAPGPQPPILMLTARDDLVARMQGRGAGASEFLVKGPDFEAVVASVLDFIKRASTELDPRSSTELDLLAKGVAASGLAHIIAEAAIQRACRRAGIDPKTMTGTELQRALPAIEKSLAVFLPAADRVARLRAVRAIVGEGDSQ